MCCGPLAELFYRTFKETNKLTTSRKTNNDHFITSTTQFLDWGRKKTNLENEVATSVNGFQISDTDILP